MAKQGMKRPEEFPERKKKKEPPVHEIQGTAKNSKAKANPIIEPADTSALKVYHTDPISMSSIDKPISDAYPEIDNDLARDNLQVDIPEADLGEA